MDRLLDTNVRYFDNNVTTAQLKNEWGSIVKVLDEVLVYGSNEQNILSITTVEDVQDSRYWVSTVLLNENHKFEKDIHVVEIKGASDSNFTPCSLNFGDSDRYYPSKMTVNSINPNTGQLLNSPVFIKDSNKDFRGELRGIKQFYGSGELQNNILMEYNNSIVLQTKLFELNRSDGNSEQVPYLFSFKNWEL